MIEVTKRPYLVNWSGNNIYYELYSADAEADSTITFDVAIMFGRGTAVADFTEVIVLPFVPFEGRALFDIKDIIDAQLSFDMPEFADESMICSNQTGYFYIEFREITPANPDPSFIATEFDILRTAVKGGVHPYHYKGNNFWLTYNPAEKNFFTWKPQGQLVLPTEQTWLAFFYDGDEANVLAQMEVQYKDGSTDTFTRTIPVETHSMILLQSSLYFDWDGGLGFDADNVYRWKVRIRDTGDTETLINWYMYELDNRQDYNETIIHYRNSIGGLDNCRVRGVIEKRLSYELQQAEHILPVDYFNETVLAPQQSTTASSENVIQNGEIGFVTKAEQESLRDIFLYRLLYIKKQNRWWPLLLLTDGFTLKRSTDMRWSVPLEWKVALTAINHYTEEETDFGEGVNTNNVNRATVLVTLLDDPIEEPPASGLYQGGATIDIDTNPDSITITGIEYRTSFMPESIWYTASVGVFFAISALEAGDSFLYFRSVATGNLKGPTLTVPLTISGIVIPPMTNSTIVCPYDTSIKIYRENVLIYNGVGIEGSFTPHDFDCADGNPVVIEVRFGSIRPFGAELISNGSYVADPDSIILRKAIFNDVDAVSGIAITIP